MGDKTSPRVAHFFRVARLRWHAQKMCAVRTLLKDREKWKKVVEEIDKLELEFSEVNDKAQ